MGTFCDDRDEEEDDDEDWYTYRPASIMDEDEDDEAPVSAVSQKKEPRLSMLEFIMVSEYLSTPG